MNRAKMALAASILWTANAGAWAATDSFPWQMPAVSGAQTVRVDQLMFDSVTLGTFRIAFEKTHLADVIAAVVSGRIEHQGDAAGSFYWLCYRFRDGGKIRQLGVFAHGEMGGSKHAVTDIVLSDRLAEPAERCPLLPARFAPVASNTGLGLDSTRADFVTHLGGSGGQSQSKASWNFAHVFGGSPVVWTTNQWVDAEFQGDRPVIIVFGQTTSN